MSKLAEFRSPSIHRGLRGMPGGMCWGGSLALMALSSQSLAQTTRAPEPVQKSKIKVETIARGLEHPWAVQELPDGRFLISERSGRLRIVEGGGKLSKPIGNVPKVQADGQGGLLDVALAPDFDRSSRIYFAYAEPRGGGRSGTAVATGWLAPGEAPALAEVRVIFRQKPEVNSALHFGSRIVFAADGTMFVTLGERYSGRDQAQAGNNHFGKVVRITSSGAPASATPHAAGWLPEIWSIGHRNAQGAALHPQTGALWLVEHGARGGDELNVVQAGRNYGWPVITYGRDYSGAKIGVGVRKQGLEQPVYYWDPSIAPAGMTFYTSDRYPGWMGSLFVGALAGSHLSRLTLEGGRVTSEERLLVDLGARIRDVRQARDGSLLVLTDEARGRLLRITPLR